MKVPALLRRIGFLKKVAPITTGMMTVSQIRNQTMNRGDIQIASSLLEPFGKKESPPKGDLPRQSRLKLHKPFNFHNLKKLGKVALIPYRSRMESCLRKLRSARSWKTTFIHKHRLRYKKKVPVNLHQVVSPFVIYSRQRKFPLQVGYVHVHLHARCTIHMVLRWTGVL